jgi:hypothetical protein
MGCKYTAKLILETNLFQKRMMTYFYRLILDYAAIP